jgi:hypothetical protein
MQRSCRWLVTGGELDAATDRLDLPKPSDEQVPILTDERSPPC